MSEKTKDFIFKTWIIINSDCITVVIYILIYL